MAWGGAGDGDVDRDLAVLLAVDGLDAEGFGELFGQPGGGAGEDVAVPKQRKLGKVVLLRIHALDAAASAPLVFHGSRFRRLNLADETDSL